MIPSTVSIMFPQTEEIIDLNGALNCHARGLLLSRSLRMKTTLLTQTNRNCQKHNQSFPLFLLNGYPDDAFPPV